VTGRGRFLAFDIGASGGRAVLGDLDGGRLALREVSRFPNRPISAGGHLCWDIPAQWEGILGALAVAALYPGRPIESVAVDTFGVDFALLAPDGGLLGRPVCYRDPRTQGAVESFFARLPRERVFELTGVQTLPINTLFQLHAMARERSPLLAAAAKLLFLPDLFGHFLTGVARSELTIASTSQMYDPRAKRWAPEILAALGLPEGLMPEVAPPGAALGSLRPSVAGLAGLPPLPVIAAAGHDTACAVAAVPAEDDRFAYVSCGTWSLVGIEVPRPVITPEAQAANFTNEGGAAGGFRLLKNVAGLWLVEECRRAFGDGPGNSLADLEAAAVAAPPFAALLDPDWPGFLCPPAMPSAIESYLRATDQRVPESRGGLLRVILDSLALKTRLVLDEIRSLTPRPMERVHLVGGGSRSDLLGRLIAEATGLPVLAGPAEATAAGNLLLQAAAARAISGPATIREVSRRSFPVRRFEPEGGPGPDRAFAAFKDLCRAEVPPHG
jgi:rhamnulokinase